MYPLLAQPKIVIFLLGPYKAKHGRLEVFFETIVYSLLNGTTVTGVQYQGITYPPADHYDFVPTDRTTFRYVVNLGWHLHEDEEMEPIKQPAHFAVLEFLETLDPNHTAVRLDRPLELRWARETGGTTGEVPPIFTHYDRLILP